MAQSTATETTDLDPAAGYAVYYVENLRTGRNHQIAYVTGETAQQMRDRSPEPRRLIFVQS